MTYTLTPLTKLDAVNICLSAMGEPQVNSLDGVAVDAQMAASLIDETSMTVQAIGWHWNREIHTLSPNTNGEIVLPANTARVDTVNGSLPVDVVQRGPRLFDVANNTYQFTSPLEVEIFVVLDFEELPLLAKQYITIRAARILQQRLLGSDTLYKFVQADEQTAWIALQTDNAAITDANMLTDSWSVGRILSRGFFARGAY